MASCGNLWQDIGVSRQVVAIDHPIETLLY